MVPPWTVLAIKLSTGKWLAAGGGLCALLTLVALFFVCVLAVRIIRGARAARAGARAGMLAGLGYQPTGTGKWARPVDSVPVLFEETSGWKWTTRLSKYGTLDLRVVERKGIGLGALSSGAFVTQDAELDERFVVESNRPSQALALLSDDAISNALLALRHVDLTLIADELVLHDPELLNLRSLAGARAQVGQGRAVPAEASVHEAFARLATAVARAMRAG